MIAKLISKERTKRGSATGIKESSECMRRRQVPLRRLRHPKRTRVNMFLLQGSRRGLRRTRQQLCLRDWTRMQFMRHLRRMRKQNILWLHVLRR
ncbi:uncharacterized protein LOC111047674 isoform X2 [Nilaparvata lugens]|uniref:uncharacterized protein LOC111047674 isoform X2 n=1 Tax=Nilaparvata lugens TaxID=108931 RepID=UPI00193E29E8|nr:uncharacterized protein LOC111047674 isoform X2 [Nilaparvata lugens]